MPPRTRTTPPRSASFSDAEDVNDFVKPRHIDEEKSETKDAPKYTPGKYKEPLHTFYTGVGMALAQFGAERTSTALLAPTETGEKDHTGEPVMTTGAEQCAISIDNWAKVNPRVRKVLDYFSGASVFTAVAAAHAPIIGAAASELGAFKQMGNLFRSFRKDMRDATQEEPPRPFYSNPGAAVA